MQNVSYRYNKKAPWVLKNLSVDFEPGTFTAIFGASGSGKSTCLMLLGALDKPIEGNIVLDGKSVDEIGSRIFRQKEIGYVFQDFRLFTHMSALENVMTAVGISLPDLLAKEIRAKSQAALMDVGLETADLNRKVTKLSGGQQQRVAIARALASDADYILADEPTGNLDKENTENILVILKELAKEKGKCVICATHSERVLTFADCSYEMEHGNLEKIN